MIKVNFYLREDKTNSHSKCPIWIQSRFNSGKIIRKPTGYFCDPDKWITKKGNDYQRPKGDPTLKAKLNSLVTDIENAYTELKPKLGKPTLNDIWEHLYPTIEAQPETPESVKIVDWVDHYITTSTHLKLGYVRGAKLISAHLTGKYIKTYKYHDPKTYRIKDSDNKVIAGYNPNMTFAQLNQTNINALCGHLAKTGMLNGTINKVLKFLKQMGAMARDNGVKVGSLDFTMPGGFIRKAKSEIRLTFGEVIAMRDAELEDGAQRTIRDIFVLTCFCGLAHADVMKLKVEDIKEDYIDTSRLKNANIALPTINIYSRPILDAYMKGKRPEDLLFPQYRQQIYNRVIKIVGSVAKINQEERQTSYSGSVAIVEKLKRYELIVSHTGRRSYSRMLDKLDISERMIAEELGQGTQNITQHYIGEDDHNERIEKMQSAWKRANVVFNGGAKMVKLSA